MLSRAAAVLAFTLVAAQAQSAVVIEFREVASDIVATLSGSLDLTGATQNAFTAQSGASFIVPGQSRIVFPNLAEGGTLRGYAWQTPAAPFGSGATNVAGSYAGNVFVTSDSNVYLSGAYVSGTALSGTFTLLGIDFAGAGLMAGSSYVYALPQDTVTIRILPTAPIPLPATALLLIGGLAGLAGLPLMRSRRTG